MLVHRHIPPPTALPGSPIPAPTALTIGNFDGVHLGHQALLREVTAQATVRGLMPCVMTFEPHPREFFAPHAAPTRLTSLREKLAQLAAHGIARTQVMHFNKAFSSLSADDFIERVIVQGLNAKWVMIGDDFRFGAKRQGDFAHLQRVGRERGFEVVAMPTVRAPDGTRISSSVVREVLSAGDVERAATLLGRPYSLMGRVMHGDKIGRTLGFPTANIQMRHGLTATRAPLAGIFAVRVFGTAPNPDKPIAGAASIGVRPTVTNSNELRLEVFLLDFAGDLYGKHLRVEFLKHIRPEEKYRDLETLTAQIAQDVVDVRGFFEREAGWLLNA